MNYIKFENKEYPYRELFMHDFGNVVVSTDSLNQVLMNEDGTYTTKDAKLLDEEIFFFVEDADIFLKDSLLAKQIKKNIW